MLSSRGADPARQRTPSSSSSSTSRTTSCAMPWPICKGWSQLMPCRPAFSERRDGLMTSRERTQARFAAVLSRKPGPHRRGRRHSWTALAVASTDGERGNSGKIGVLVWAIGTQLVMNIVDLLIMSCPGWAPVPHRKYLPASHCSTRYNFHSHPPCPMIHLRDLLLSSMAQVGGSLARAGIAARYPLHKGWCRFVAHGIYIVYLFSSTGKSTRGCAFCPQIHPTPFIIVVSGTTSRGARRGEHQRWCSGWQMQLLGGGFLNR